MVNLFLCAGAGLVLLPFKAAAKEAVDDLCERLVPELNSD